MPRKSKVDILAEKAAAGDVEALKELAALAKPKPKKKVACNVKHKAARKKKAIQVVKDLPQNTEPVDPQPEVASHRTNSQLQSIQQRRANKVNEIQVSKHLGKTPAKFAPFQVKERPNRFDVDKKFAALHKKHLDEVKIHKGTVGVDRTRESVDYAEVTCVYCRRQFTVPTSLITGEDGRFFCNACSASPKIL